MSHDWVSNPILCQGEIASPAINPRQPLLPMRAQIVFRAYLLYNAWQAYACDGRQMSIEDFDRMEQFEARFADASLDEDLLRQIVEDFGDFLPRFLTNGPVDAPERALIWTQRDANK